MLVFLSRSSHEREMDDLVLDLMSTKQWTEEGDFLRLPSLLQTRTIRKRKWSINQQQRRTTSIHNLLGIEILLELLFP